MKMYSIFQNIIYPILVAIAWLMMPVASTGQSPEGKKPLVVATASIFADMAASIGGDLIETATIVPIGGDPHIYEPTPGDVRLLLKADLILQNGLTFEGWIRDLIANSGSKAPVVTLTDGVTPITSQQYQNATDPHAWMDPVNGLVYAANIRKALTALLPGQADRISSSYDAYVHQLQELDTYIKDQVALIDSSRRILITSHDAFHYYGKRYGLRLEAILGTSTDADVRTSDILRVQEVIRTHKVPVVFMESTINPKLLNQIAADNKIAMGGKLYSDSLGEPDGPAGTYTGMLRHNTDVIVKGLTSSAESETEAPRIKGPGGMEWIILGGVLLLLLAPLVILIFRRKIFNA